MKTLVFYFVLLLIVSMLIEVLKPKIKGWMGEKAAASVQKSSDAELCPC